MLRSGELIAGDFFFLSLVLLKTTPSQFLAVIPLTRGMRPETPCSMSTGVEKVEEGSGRG